MKEKTILLSVLVLSTMFLGLSAFATAQGGGVYTESSGYCEIDKVSCIITLRTNSVFQEEVGGKTHSFLIEAIPDYSPNAIPSAVILIDGNSVSLKSNREAFFDDIKIEDVKFYLPNDATRRYVEFRIRNFENTTATSEGSSEEEITCTDNDSLDYSTKSETIVQKGNSKLTVTDQCLKDLKSLADQYPTYQNILNNMISEGVLSSSDVKNENILIEAYCPSNIDLSFNAPLYQKSYICANGCNDGACLEEAQNECETIGLRQEGQYCSSNKTLEEQKETDASCENNFECSSNLCINSQCVSGSLWTKFIQWLGRLFG